MANSSSKGKPAVGPAKSGSGNEPVSAAGAAFAAKMKAARAAKRGGGK